MKLKQLIEKISYIRTRANLSARALSISIGKNSSYISVMEQSKSFAPSFETLCDILDACNVTFEEFFYNDIVSYKKHMELLKLIQSASKERVDLAIQMLTTK